MLSSDGLSSVGIASHTHFLSLDLASLFTVNIITGTTGLANESVCPTAN